MISKKMTVLIIEDDNEDCKNFIKSAKNDEEVEIIGITDSDVEGLAIAEAKKPEGIILDLELNNSATGNIDSFDFLQKVNKLKPDYQPIIIVTTHVNSKRTYQMLHRNGVDLILYKDHLNYSSQYVLNRITSLRSYAENKYPVNEKDQERKKQRELMSKLIYQELNMIGINSKLKGRQYIHDAIIYLIENEDNSNSIIQYLTKIHKRSATTITNGIQNAIIRAWRVTPIEDLMMCYKARVNYETGIPTPMELIYYYRDEIKKKI